MTPVPFDIPILLHDNSSTRRLMLSPWAEHLSVCCSYCYCGEVKPPQFAPNPKLKSNQINNKMMFTQLHEPTITTTHFHTLLSHMIGPFTRQQVSFSMKHTLDHQGKFTTRSAPSVRDWLLSQQTLVHVKTCRIGLVWAIQTEFSPDHQVNTIS